MITPAGTYLLKPTEANKSGTVGVCKYKTTHSKKPWHAYGYSYGKKVCLGYFSNEEDAVTARKNWESER